MAKSLEKGEALLVIKEDGCKLVGYNYFMLDGPPLSMRQLQLLKGIMGTLLCGPQLLGSRQLA